MAEWTRQAPNRTRAASFVPSAKRFSPRAARPCGCVDESENGRYYLTATTTYLDAFRAAKAAPVAVDFSQSRVETLRTPIGGAECQEFDCESVIDDDGITHDVGFRSVRNMAAAMAAKARTANRIVDLTFRRDFREDIDTPLTDIDQSRAWGIADWAQRGAVGAYFDWAVLNHLLRRNKAMVTKLPTYTESEWMKCESWRPRWKRHRSVSTLPEAVLTRWSWSPTWCHSASSNRVSC